MIVKKFGGTSVGSIERIESLANRLALDVRSGQKPIVVASAMSGETNRLIALGERIDPDCRGPAYDMLLASGEQVSISLLAMALEKRGVQAQPLLAYQIGIQTDSVHAKARIQRIDGAKLSRLAESGCVPIVAGFQGVSEGDEITTLGRGGSDTTAVALAAAIGARECEIFTDVPAVFTADPRLVPKARELARLSFDEMMEMASLGSKVLHIRCVELGPKYGVPIHERTSFDEREGTWIVPEGEIMEHPLVSAVTHDPSAAIFRLFPVPSGPDFLGDLFEKLAARGVVVDIIAQSANDGPEAQSANDGPEAQSANNVTAAQSANREGQRLAFSVSKEDVPLARQTLRDAVGPETRVSLSEGLAKVSVVGVGMRNHPGVAARFFRTLARESVPIHLITTSEIKMSAVIDFDRLERAARALHSEFGLDREREGADL